MVPFDASPPKGTSADRQFSYAVPDEIRARFAAFYRDSLYYRRVSPATAKWYRHSFSAYVKYLAAAHVTTLDPDTAVAALREWLASSQDREHPISPFTARSYWQALRAYFVYLEHTDGFPSPYRIVKPPVVPDHLPKSLTYEQCVRVLAAARAAPWRCRYERARAVAMLATALYAGLRRNEILGLAVDDVQIDDQRIVITRGKGRGGGSQRIAYINPELAVLLLDYIDARKEAKLLSVEFFTAMVPRRGPAAAAARARKDPDAKYSGHGVKERTFARIVAIVRRTAGFRFTVHMLRHSFVSMLARQPGVSIQHIRELAGHRDMKTTERYMRLFEEDKLRAVSTLSFMPGRLAGPRPDAVSGSPPRTPVERHGYSG